MTLKGMTEVGTDLGEFVSRKFLLSSSLRRVVTDHFHESVLVTPRCLRLKVYR